MRLFIRFRISIRIAHPHVLGLGEQILASLLHLALQYSLLFSRRLCCRAHSSPEASAVVSLELGTRRLNLGAYTGALLQPYATFCSTVFEYDF